MSFSEVTNWEENAILEQLSQRSILFCGTASLSCQFAVAFRQSSATLRGFWIPVRGSGTETGFHFLPSVENNPWIRRVVFSDVLTGDFGHEVWKWFDNPASFLAEFAGSRKIVNGDGVVD